MIEFANAASYWAGATPTWKTLSLISDWGGIIYGAAPPPPTNIYNNLLLLGVGT